jgi:hypothetical protein
MVVFTGDYMNWPGDETMTLEVMRRFCEPLHPPMGMFGVYGNHDSPHLRRALDSLPINWLNNDGHRFDDLPLEIWGADTAFISRDTDGVALAQRISCSHIGPPRPQLCDLGAAYDQHPVRVLLCHMPTFLPTAGDLQMDLMLSGHTHGGQCRLPGRRALINSTDLPLHLTSGVLRHLHTLCAISRGVGEVILPIRIMCKAHVPVYTLRQGARIGVHTHEIQNVVPW